MMITGITVLALAFCMPQLRAMDKPDFEKLLPIVLSAIRAGGRASASCSPGCWPRSCPTSPPRSTPRPPTSSTTSTSASSIPTPPRATEVVLSRIASLVVLVIGILFGLLTDRITDVMMWIVGALYGGYVMANVLKWYWWRFNGYGYFWGMMTGIAGAMFVPNLARIRRSAIPSTRSTRSRSSWSLSLVGCLLGTLLSKPEDEAILKEFYSTVHPWGFWGPIRHKVEQEDPGFQPNRDCNRDWTNVLVGIVWQLCLTALPIYLVLRNGPGSGRSWRCWS